MDDDPDTADLDDRVEPQQAQQALPAPYRKPRLRQRVRAVLEKLKPFPACD